MLFKALSDAVLISVSFIFAYFLRFKILLFITPETVPLLNQYLNILIFIMVLWLAVFNFVGLYDKKKFAALPDELAGLFIGVSLNTLILLGLLYLNKEFWLSRLVVVNAWWVSFFLLATKRALGWRWQRLRRLKGWGLKKTLILGADEIGQALAGKITQDRGLGYQLVGFLDDDPTKLGQSFQGAPVLGQLNQAGEFINSLEVKEIIIASSGLAVGRILDIITECEKFRVEFKIVPGVLELIASRLDIDELGGLPLLTVSEIRLQGLKALAKRTADMILSSLLIAALAPFWAVFAVLVKLTSAGPVILGQPRLGLEGAPFPMYKFRSMIQNAEELFPQLAPWSETEGYIFKIKDDPRVTPLGKFMRRFSLDELPQLFNVLFGQMSLVGPRPPLPREVVRYNAWHKKRLRVRPGITGPWQVSGRSLLPFEEMVRLDIYYIENWSLWLDFKILLRTIPVVIFGRGAY